MILTQVALLRLDAGLRAVERGTILACPGMEGPQKNYLPLVLGGELYLVIQAYPLIVGRVDPGSLACSVVQRDEGSPLSLQAVRVGGREGEWLSISGALEGASAAASTVRGQRRRLRQQGQCSHRRAPWPPSPLLPSESHPGTGITQEKPS